MSEQLTENDGVSNEGGQGQGDVTGKYGRRALILGAAAGVGAAASLAAKPDTAGANGTPVELGESNTATATTSVETSAGSGLVGVTTANANSGVYGVDESSAGGWGVYGQSDNGTGVEGYAGDTNGDTGVTAGVVGYSTSDAGEAGVYGRFMSTGRDDNGYGVYGWSDAGPGVYGLSGSGPTSGLLNVANDYGVAGDTGQEYGIGVAGDPAGVTASLEYRAPRTACTA